MSPIFLHPFEAFAEAESLSNPTSVVSIFLSLLLVVGIVFMLAFLMRRFNVTQSGSSQMKVVASMMAGTKERILVVEVGEEQHLLGITSHNINHLPNWTSLLADNASQPGTRQFKDKLTLALSRQAPSWYGQR